MPAKKPWMSKTILMNFAMGILAAAALMVPAAKGLSDFITANAAAIGVIWSVLAIALRMVSGGKISLED